MMTLGDNGTCPVCMILIEIEMLIKDVILVILTSFPQLCRCGSRPKEPAILRGYPDQL